MKYFIESGHDAAIKALKHHDFSDLDRIDENENIIINVLFARLASNRTPYAYQETENNIILWTRSPRPGVIIQESHLWKKNGELIPVSHANINSPEEMLSHHGYYADAYILEA